MNITIKEGVNVHLEKIKIIAIPEYVHTTMVARGIPIEEVLGSLGTKNEYNLGNFLKDKLSITDIRDIFVASDILYDIISGGKNRKYQGAYCIGLDSYEYTGSVDKDTMTKEVINVLSDNSVALESILLKDNPYKAWDIKHVDKNICVILRPGFSNFIGYSIDCLKFKRHLVSSLVDYSVKNIGEKETAMSGLIDCLVG